MKKLSGLKSNNAGLSLLELIVVVAIMAVVGGIVVLSTSVATDKHVSSCAEKITTSLEQTRSLALGKRTAYIDFTQVTGEVVQAQMYVDGQPYGNLCEIGRSGLTITLTYDDGSAEVLTAASPARIEFSRSNGSIINQTGANSGKTIVSIDVTNTRRDVLVKIDKFTGRIETERIS